MWEFSVVYSFNNEELNTILIMSDTFPFEGHSMEGRNRTDYHIDFKFKANRCKSTFGLHDSPSTFNKDEKATFDAKKRLAAMQLHQTRQIRLVLSNDHNDDDLPLDHCEDDLGSHDESTFSND